MGSGYKVLPGGEQLTSTSNSQWPIEAFAGLLAAILILVLNVSSASVVFHKGCEYENYLPHGINIFIVCTALSNTIMLLTSHLPLISGANAFVGSLYAHMAHRILKYHPESPFATLAAAMGMCTLVMGIGHWILGAARIGKAVQFVPTPVMAGFQASIGYVLMNSSIEMLSGCEITQAACLYDAPSYAQLALTVVLGGWLTIAQSYLRGVWRTLLIPGTLAVVILAYQLLRRNLYDEQALDSWTLELPAESAISAFADLQLAKADWIAALWEAGRCAATAFVPNVINILLTLSALEQRRVTDVDVDYDYELRSLGIVYVATTATMMAPNPQASVMLFAADLGARSRLAAWMVIASSLAVATLGCEIVNRVPTIAFAGLLFSNGLILLASQITLARKLLPLQEQVLVIFHISLTSLLGMLSAVILGLACTALLFVMEYTKHSGVMQTATSQLERARVERPLIEQEFLQTEGASIFIVHLHGMIFFGSANAVLETVRAHVKTLEQQERQLCCLVLDFERCSEVDSSAVTILLQAQRTIRKATLVVAAASLPILRKLEATSANVQDVLGDRIFSSFSTLDLALEFCETQLLSTSTSRSIEASFPACRSEQEEDMRVYSQRSSKSDLQAQDWEDARKRYLGHLRALGACDLEALFEHMDIVCMRPNTLIRTYCPGAGLSSNETTRDLFILDLGNVTSWLSIKTLQKEERNSYMQKLPMLPLAPNEDCHSPRSPSKLKMWPPTSRSSGDCHDHIPSTRNGVLESLINSLPSSGAKASEGPKFARGQALQHRWHRLMKSGPGTFIGCGPFASAADADCLQHGTVFPRVYQCDAHCQFLRLSRSQGDKLEQEEPVLMQKLYKVLAGMCDSFAANHAMALLASEAFNVTIRPSRAFGRWLVVRDDHDTSESSHEEETKRSISWQSQ